MSHMDSFQILTKPDRTERIDRLYQYITSFKYGICTERGRYLTEFYRRNMHLTPILRRAKAIEYVLENMTLYLMPGSYFAGNQASKPRWAPLFPEFDVEWLESEIIQGKPFFPWDRPADQYLINDGEQKTVQSICDWWRGQTHTDRLRARLPKEALHTHFDIKAADIGAYFQGGDGHYSPHHEWLMQNGLQKIIDDCSAHLEQIDWAREDAVPKKDFYEAAIISAGAVIKYAARYAEMAENLALGEKDALRRQDLLDIAAMCRWVPRNPARTFKEALQFMILVHTCIQIEDNGAGISFGRFDQFMKPYYDADLEAGRLTREQALEYVENFFLQIYTCNKVRSWADTDFFRGVPMFQNLTIGGQDPKTKSDATNELSYICLDATYHTRIPQPSLTVRFHKKTPYAFKIRVAEVIRLGLGLPSIFNDEVYIPALLNKGYELDDAYDYCIIGCVEPGTSGLLGGRTGGAWLNCQKALEISLYGGKDPRTGLMLHPNAHGKDLATFEAFQDVVDAFQDQMAYYIRMEDRKSVE